MKQGIHLMSSLNMTEPSCEESIIQEVCLYAGAQVLLKCSV